MIDVLIYILVGAGAFFFGWKLREAYAKYIVMKYYDELEKMAGQVKNDIVHVDVSQHGESFLVHNNKTGQFLAQGASFNDAVNNLYKAFPNKVFTANSDAIKSMKSHDTI